MRVEVDASQAKVEELTAKVKTLEQENLAKAQEITSLSHRNQLLEAEVEKLEGGIKDYKTAAVESASQGKTNEALQRRMQLLEDEAEEADKNLRETNEKCVLGANRPIPLEDLLTRGPHRLRQTDIKAGHYERKVQALESARDQWETKYEEMSKKYSEANKALEDFRREIEGL